MVWRRYRTWKEWDDTFYRKRDALNKRIAQLEQELEEAKLREDREFRDWFNNVHRPAQPEHTREEAYLKRA